HCPQSRGQRLSEGRPVGPAIGGVSASGGEDRPPGLGSADLFFPVSPVNVGKDRGLSFPHLGRSQQRGYCRAMSQACFLISVKWSDTLLCLILLCFCFHVCVS
uniref:Uncharacterized protein n=1 Tax=Spermophilus dauricus TaxID=99837 RepID=A0A8C9QDD9_SPEDA